MLLLAFAALSGLWDASVTFDQRTVPFRMEITSSGARASAVILDGTQRIETTSGRFDGRTLELRWAYYDAVLTARLEKGELRGAYVRRTKQGPIPRPINARPHHAGAPAAKAEADLSGAWILSPETASARNRAVLEAVFRQSGAEVAASVQRVDGDFGALEGRMAGKRFVLSHFDGVRATLLEGELLADGSLVCVLDQTLRYHGVRANEAQARGLPAPPDPTRFTGVKNPEEPFQFTFPDLDGKPVSLSDARFRGKAAILTITGSWCPNCHEEAPFLVELHEKFGPQGLEIVVLGFEYTGEPETDRKMLREFAKRHGIRFPVLLAGSTDEGEVPRKLPQLKDFGAFPTTLFLDRAHRVRAVHAGFSGPSTGAAYTRLRAETEALVKDLLNQR
jgi:thiol-disulfide isomerase/thioredoxin